MRQYLSSAGRFFVGLVKRSWWLLPTILLDPFDLLELAGLKLSIPGWILWSVFGLAVFIAGVGTFHEERTRADKLAALVAPQLDLVIPENRDMRRDGLSRLPPNFRNRPTEEFVPTESLVLEVRNTSDTEPATSVVVEVTRAEPELGGGIDRLPHELPWFNYESSWTADIPAKGHRFVRIFDVYRTPEGLLVNGPTQAHIMEGIDEVTYMLTVWAAGSPSVSRKIHVSELAKLTSGELPNVTEAAAAN